MATQNPNVRALASQVGNSITSIANYIQETLVSVDVHVGRMRVTIPLPAIMDGTNTEDMTDEVSFFYSKYVSKKVISFLPEEYATRLNELEYRARQAVASRSVNKLMPVDKYTEFKAELEQLQKEYFEARDEIIANWASIYGWFEANLKDLVDSLHYAPALQDKIMADILNKIPSKAEYEASFYMNAEVQPFHPVLSANGLNKDIADDVLATTKRNVKDTLVGTIEVVLVEGWERIMSAEKQYIAKGSIRNSTIEGLLKYAEDLDWKNLFKNTCLHELESDLKALVPGSEENAEILEEAMLDIYEYAKETRIHLPFDKIPYTEDQLDAMLLSKRHYQTA